MKNITMILFFIFIAFFLNACVHQINKQGIVLSISKSQLSNSFNDSFPFKKNFLFGELKLTNPKIDMYKNDHRIHASIDLALKTVFTGALRGSFAISGKPLLKKESSEILLKNITLKYFNFGKLKISKEFSNTFKSALESMINKIFEKYPVYKIPKESIHGNFIKDIKIEDSKLLVTYGI